MCQGEYSYPRFELLPNHVNNWIRHVKSYFSSSWWFGELTRSCLQTQFLLHLGGVEWVWELLYAWNSIPSPTAGARLSRTVGLWQRYLHSWEFSHVNSTEVLWDSKHIACKEVCTTILIQSVTDEKGLQTHHSTGNQSIMCPWLLSCWVTTYCYSSVQLRLSEDYV